MTQELAKQRSQIAGSSLETDDVRSQGRMDHSTIKLNDERLKFITTLSSANTDFFYEFPGEPDLNFLKVWFMLDHLGSRMRDMSGFGHDAIITGHPTLRRAGLDLGFQQTGIASATPVMLFNSGTDVVSQLNGEYIWIPDHFDIQFTRFSAGFSIAFRFNCLDFNSHFPPAEAGGGSYSRRFAAKTDNATNGWNLLVYPTNAQGTQGGVEFEMLHDNVQYARRTTGYSINNWYQVIVTYNPNVTADQRIKIYTAGVENSLSSTYGTILPTHTNLRIGARDSETGFFFGYIHDFRLYMGKVLTQTEITNLNQNELTIDNIVKGHVFVTQYALVSQVIRSRTHKYNVGGDVKRERTHKFNISSKVTRTRTHKFTILNKITRTRTHKFTINIGVLRTRIHKYHIGGKVIRTRTHRFNVGGKITVSKTHKYNISTQILLYNVSDSGSAILLRNTSSSFRSTGTRISSTSHPLYQKVPTRVIVSLDGRGMTAGTVYCRIYASNGTTIRKNIASKPVSSLGNGKTSFTFEDTSMTSADQLQLNEYLVIEVEDISISTNYIVAYRNISDVIANATLFRYHIGTGWSETSTADWAAEVYGF